MLLTAFDCLQMGIATQPGWTGVFTRKEYPGAMPNGTRIVKSKLEAGDMHPVGSLGTVLGSIGHRKLAPDIGYFIAWDAHPSHAVFVHSTKIAKAEP